MCTKPRTQPQPQPLKFGNLVQRQSSSCMWNIQPCNEFIPGLLFSPWGPIKVNLLLSKLFYRKLLVMSNYEPNNLSFFIGEQQPQPSFSQNSVMRIILEFQWIISFPGLISLQTWGFELFPKGRTDLLYLDLR